MTDALSGRRQGFQACIERFLHERRDGKLDKLANDDSKRDALIAQYQYSAWIADAARRVAQIQVVTHTLKAVHPDAKGTNLYCAPQVLPTRAEVGSHCLGADFAGDVVGNAAALDVYKFLRLDYDGQSLLSWMQAGDADLAAALSDDPAQAQSWIQAFTSITLASSELATHTRAKQVYWLVGQEPASDQDYHLLAPLHASSLAHRVFQTINEDRFGEAAKLARQARREKRAHPTGYCDYPQLAVRKLGGTKPQNISQLNSERGGNNYLLASLPPVNWKPLSNGVQKSSKASVFETWGRHLSVWITNEDVIDFLKKDPAANMATRDKRDDLTDFIIHEILRLAKQMQDLPPGWSAAAECQLAEEEKLWLDPRRAEQDAVFRKTWRWMDWPVAVCKRYANWLNGELEKHLPLGEREHHYWAKQMGEHKVWLGLLKAQERSLDAYEKRQRKEEAA